MAKFSRLQVYQAMEETGIIPVFYHPDVEVAKAAVKACYEGGIRAFEFTNRGDFAHEVFTELVKWTDTACPRRSWGWPVVDAPTAAHYIQLAPTLWLARCLTPIFVYKPPTRPLAGCPPVGNRPGPRAAEIVKVFRGNRRSLFREERGGPMPWSKIMVTAVEPPKRIYRRGLTRSLLRGDGVKPIPEKAIEEGDWSTITQLQPQQPGDREENKGSLT